MAIKTDPLKELHLFVSKYPTQAAAARALDISAPYLFDMVNGRRDISEPMLNKLGLERVVTVVRAS